MVFCLSDPALKSPFREEKNPTDKEIKSIEPVRLILFNFELIGCIRLFFFG